MILGLIDYNYVNTQTNLATPGLARGLACTVHATDIGSVTLRQMS